MWIRLEQLAFKCVRFIANLSEQPLLSKRENFFFYHLVLNFQSLRSIVLTSIDQPPSSPISSSLLVKLLFLLPATMTPRILIQLLWILPSLAFPCL